jgi:transcriptional regulator with XRE-family HTH domain
MAPQKSTIVSNNIKYLRKLHNLTQEEFSARIGIKRSLLGAYEEARANPNLDNLMAMARAFNLQVDHLLKQDLRKIRDTPDLKLPLEREQEREVTPPLPVAPTPAARQSEPQILNNIFEQYHKPSMSAMPAANWEAPTAPRPVAPAPPPPAPTPPPAPVVSSFAVPQPLVFNNAYEGGAAPIVAPPAKAEKIAPQLIQYVSQSQLAEYVEKLQNPAYLGTLPVFQLPLLPNGHYRAFEAGDDFAYPGAYLIGQFVKNWYDIADGKSYIVVARQMGAVYRRLFNQVKIKGTLLLSSDKTGIPTFELPIKDVVEVWEIKAFFSTILPEPTVSLNHLRHLASQIQEELDRIKK